MSVIRTSILNYKDEEKIYSGEVIIKKSRYVATILPDGNGKAFYFEGAMYDGQWVNGLMHGIGLFVRKKLYTYTGRFENNLTNGYGKLVYNEGSIYSMEGNWIDNELNGESTIIYRSGNKYVGGVLNGMRHGKGMMYDSKGAISEGTWFEDVLDGVFIAFMPNGNQIITRWKKGKKKDIIEIYYAGGAFYRGHHDSEFRPHGYGMLANFQDYGHIGNWLRRSSEGLFYYSGGACYKGNWVHGMREGEGICVYSNKDYYSGTWLNDNRHGIGLYYIDFSSSVGEYNWENDQSYDMLEARFYYY